MAIRLMCPGCASALAVPETLLGKTVRCTKCSKTFSAAHPAVAPKPEAAPPAPEQEEVLLATLVEPDAVIPSPSVRVGGVSRMPSREDDRRRPTGRQQPLSLRAPAPSGNTGLIIALVAGGIGLLVLIVGGLGAFFLMSSAAPEPPPVDFGRKKIVQNPFPPFPKDMPPFDNMPLFPPDPKVVPQQPPFAPPQPMFPNPPAVPEPVRIELPPANTEAMDLKPAELDEAIKTVTLPGTIADVKAGGGGRFLLLHLPQQKQLAVFDANEAKVVKYFSLADERAVIAAGYEKVVIAYPETRILQRWSLATFEKETTVNSPIDGTIDALAMGHASFGPVLVVTKEGGPFRSTRGSWLDVATLKKIDVPVTMPNGEGMNDPAFVHVSADGRTYGMRNGVGGEPHTVSLAVLSERGIASANSWGFGGSVLAPSADGRLLYASSGVFDASLKRVSPPDLKGCIPATQGNYFLQIDTPSKSPFDESAAKGNVRIHVQDNYRFLVQVRDIEGAAIERINYGTNQDRMTPTQRLHFIAGAKLLVSVPSSNDRLHLRRIDIDAELEKSEVDYLYVASEPNGIAVRGKDYRYPIVVKSKKGGVKLKLESGPEGMKIVDRELRWRPDGDATEKQEKIIVSITDASGQEALHAFAVSVLAAAPNRIVAPLPKAEPKAIEPKKEAEAADPMPPRKPLDHSDYVIKPPKIDRDMIEVDLPEAAEDLVVGGAGRYVLLTLPASKKVALFDVNEAKITHQFPISGDNVRIAAGLTKLVMWYPETRIAQRWDLHRREKESTQTLEFQHDAHMAMMGSASEGPLFLGAGGYYSRGKNGYTFVDPRTFKTIPLGGVNRTDEFITDFTRISANGLTMTSWQPGLSPQGVRIFTIGSRDVQLRSQHETAGGLYPSAEGRRIYSSMGIYSPEAVLIERRTDHREMSETIPSVHGNFRLVLRTPLIGSSRDSGRSASLYCDESKESLAEWPKLLDDALNHPAHAGNDKFGIDKRVLFIPDANVLLSIPASRKSIRVHRIDVEDAMRKKGIEYLLVRSRSPLNIHAGGDYDYPIQVASSKGGVKFALQASPDGMTISPEGRITWRALNSPSDHSVIVAISDASGKEMFHSFTLRVATAP